MYLKFLEVSFVILQLVHYIIFDGNCEKLDPGGKMLN